MFNHLFYFNDISLPTFFISGNQFFGDLFGYLKMFLFLLCLEYCVKSFHHFSRFIEMAYFGFFLSFVFNNF